MADVKFYFDELLNGDRNNLAYLVSAGSESNILAKGFINMESFSLEVKNRWGGVDGVPGIGGTISSFANSLRSKVAGWSAYAEKASDSIAALGNKLGINDWLSNSEGTVSSIIEGAIDAVGTTVENLTGRFGEISQTAVESADTYMRLFNGTDVSVPLTFEEYLITDCDSTNANNDIDKKLGERLKKFAGYFTESSLTDGFIGYTKAPGNFRTSLDGLKKDSEPQGTYALVYNNYRFRGLLIDDMGIEVSTTKVKIGEGNYRPLYYKIRYTLTPAVKHTTEDFVKWFTGINSVQP